jgi:hypothetical protein
MLVLFTTIVFGALMPVFIKFFRSFDSNKEEHNYVELETVGSVDFGYLHPNFINE